MPQDQRPPKSLKRAKKMRREPTHAEQKLWLLLRDRRLAGFKFRRQMPIGPFIADFICRRPKIIVEADGGQHSESTTDEARDRWFRLSGYEVVRYWNNDILQNGEGVLVDLVGRLAALSSDETSPSTRS